MRSVLYDYLALSHMKGIGVQTIKKLLSRFGSTDKLFAAKSDALQAAGLSSAQATSLATIDQTAIEQALTWSEQAQHHIICMEDTHYPPLLHQIYQPPLILFVQGDLSLLAQAQLAIVGSRRPTAIGKENAFYFAAHLSEQGLLINSGLAIGIDTAAHQGAMSQGKTLAVLGSGFNQLYPKTNRTLADDIIASDGAIISEFALETPPLALNFPRRNRIISGLSLGVLVVEAAQRSGSLISARYALEQGREVFAIPGSIHNPLSRGCHQLIHQGAKLVETTADIFDELPNLRPLTDNIVNKANPAVKLTNDYQQLLNCIEDQATSIDSIIHRSSLSIEAAASKLLQLELDGFIEHNGDGYRRLRS